MAGIYLKLKELTESITGELKNQLHEINSPVGIASIIAGDDQSCISYLKGMKNKAEKLGMSIDIVQLDKNITEKDFLNKIEELNNDKKYSGIIIQVPLPKHIDFNKIASVLDHKKDIDCITPINQGLLFSGKPFLIPATALAVDLSLKFISKKYNIPLQGKNTVIVGRSLTVGKPTIILCLNNNMTPTVVHTKTLDTAKIASKADIIIASCGVPKMINKDWIKQEAVIIDVGIHSINECTLEGENTCKLCGDTDSKSVLEKAKILTAVPGGIGSVTSILIFANAIKSWHKINNNEDFNFEFER